MSRRRTRRRVCHTHPSRCSTSVFFARATGLKMTYLERNVLGMGLGVFLREAREFLVVPCGVVPQEDRITVRKREEELWIEGMDLVAEAREVEVPDDLRLQQAGGIREPRELDSGEDLLRNAGPSHDRSPFENEDFQAGLRQVRRGDEAVVAPA